MVAEEETRSVQTANDPIKGRCRARVTRRTPRACDRCRLKKAKCDGHSNCQTCRSNASICTYVTRRGREARSHYWLLHNVTDEALLIMYKACRKAGTFPGNILEEDDNENVTTNDILHALGLIDSIVDDNGLPRTIFPRSEGLEIDCQTISDDQTSSATTNSASLMSPPPACPSVAKTQYLNDSKVKNESTERYLTNKPNKPDILPPQNSFQPTASYESIPYYLDQACGLVDFDPQQLPKPFFDLDFDFDIDIDDSAPISLQPEYEVMA